MKPKITFLDIIIPLVVVYTTGLCLWQYFIKGNPTGNALDIIVLFLCSFFFVYGWYSFVRDITTLGVKGTIETFIKFFK